MKPQKERYLKIPYHILNLPGLGLSEKVLLAHIHSYGAKRCWESNATLAFQRRHVQMLAALQAMKDEPRQTWDDV